MSGTGGRTRREILADAAKAAAAASVAGLTGCFPGVGGRWPDAGEQNVCMNRGDGGADAGWGPDKPAFVPASNAVVEIFNEDSVTKRGAKDIIQPEVVATMLDSGLIALARQVQEASGGSPQGGAPDGDGLADAGTDINPWKILLPGYQPGFRVGLKINCLNLYLQTSGALIRATVLSLSNGLGIDPSKIIVWDRVLEEINSKARYTADDLAGAQLLGTLTSTSKATAGDPGYGDIICPAIEGETPRLSRIMTDLTDVTINLPVLKTHNVSGVTAAMKNIYGIIDIPGKYHKPKLQKALPAIYALPPVRNSLVLTITDELIAVVTGDTDSSSDATPKRLLLSQDPVAMDNYALALVNQLRKDRTPSMGPVDETVLTWIDQAHSLGLGNKNYALVKG
jgi:hypothetical protein